ncbi:PHD/YefM family antitoxin component YafN of YafNO toxin-antitoxin module [Neisseria sp. HSC-16F19]|nr:type II toxin-antitoxin system Phd/YefM family antitoxin [Neisseria sp. HSC-16F19]MCP2041564.1 PHD/YefM family antitoxin component YafN of YafNO toxin-antitoxin module [Neisseria sp. HSC-16F19]
MMKTMTSQEFNRRPNEAKKAARQAPLLITLDGKPDLLVMSYEMYQQLIQNKAKLASSSQESEV